LVLLVGVPGVGEVVGDLGGGEVGVVPGEDPIGRGCHRIGDPDTVQEPADRGDRDDHGTLSPDDRAPRGPHRTVRFTIRAILSPFSASGRRTEKELKPNK
jgi:hypothetical protein